MHQRGLFYLDGKVNAQATQIGWDVFKSMTTAKYRKNPNAPIFKHTRRREMRRHA